MNYFAFLRSFTAAAAILALFYITTIVFVSDAHCRDNFASSDTSIGNKNACFEYIARVPNLHCNCQFGMTLCTQCGKYPPNSGPSVDGWISVFDDGTLVYAAFVFIPLLLMELYRMYSMIDVIFYNNDSYRAFEYCSVLGWIAMIIKPYYLTEFASVTYQEIFAIVIDCFGIGLIFRYIQMTDASILDPNLLVTLILICGDIIGYCIDLCGVVLCKYLHNRKCNVKENPSPYLEVEVVRS